MNTATCIRAPRLPEPGAKAAQEVIVGGERFTVTGRTEEDPSFPLWRTPAIGQGGRKVLIVHGHPEDFMTLRDVEDAETPAAYSQVWDRAEQQAFAEAKLIDL